MSEITCSPLGLDTIDILEESLNKDPYHQGTTVGFFQKEGTGCNVYSDERGPIVVVRGSNVLRLDVQFLDNNDTKRNMKVLLSEFPRVVEAAKAQNFHEVLFNTNNPVLKAFCIKRLGMHEVEGDELRVIL